MYRGILNNREKERTFMELFKVRNIEKRINQLFYSVFCFYLFLATFNNTFRRVIGNIYSLDALVVHCIYILMIIPVILIVVRRLNFKNVLFMFILFVCLVFSMFNNSDAEITRKIITTFALTCLPAYVFGNAIVDFQGILDGLWKISWFVLIMLFLNVVAIGTMGTIKSDHSLAYYSLFAASVFLVSIFNKASVFFSVIGFLIAMVMMVLSNTAGALFSIAVCLILLLCNLIFSTKSIKKVILLIFIIIMIIIVVINIQSILFWSISILDKLGVNSAVVTEIWSGSTTSDRYRESIYKYVWEYSKEHLFWGSGIGYDRVLISQNTLVSLQSKFGNYAHNIFLEFMMQFGLIPGIFISFFNIWYIIKGFIQECDNEQRMVLIILCTIGIIPLMVSSTYIGHSYYFALLGYLSACKREKNLLRFEWDREELELG